MEQEKRIDACLARFPLPPSNTITSRLRTGSLDVAKDTIRLSPAARIFRRFCCERGVLTWELFQPVREILVKSSEKEIAKIQEEALMCLAIESPYTGHGHQKILQGAKAVLSFATKGIMTHSGDGTEALVADFPDVRLSNYQWTIDTGKNVGLYPNDIYQMVVEVKNVGAYEANFHWIHFSNPDENPRATITFQPERGTVESGQRTKIAVTLHLKERQDRLNEFVLLEIPGGYRIACCVRATIQPAVFGVYPNRLSQIQVQLHNSRKVRVPMILEQLKRTLESTGGLEQEGIFRLPAAASRLQAAKTALDLEEYDDVCMVDDPNITAGLIKMWFRELPDPIFSDVPFNALINCTLDELVSLSEKVLSEDCLHLFHWLIDLLSLIASHQTKNRMNPVGCAIVFVPNLVSMKETSAIQLHQYSQHMSKVFAEMIEQNLSHFNN